MLRWKHLLPILLFPLFLVAQDQYLPSQKILERPFCRQDYKLFAQPDGIFYPEIWVDCLCGNLSKEGILADLEAIHQAGFRGVQMFFGNRGGAWPGVEQIPCLSPQWEEFVRYAAQQTQRLGMRFTLQNCPGWAMAGGPWITPDKAMRHLTWSVTRIEGGSTVEADLPRSTTSEPEWRDYRDVMVLAFPIPDGDAEGDIKPQAFSPKMPDLLPPTTTDKPHVFDIQMPTDAPIRTVEFSSVQMSNHWNCYDPGIHGRMEAVYPDGTTRIMFDTDWPASNWQDDRMLSLACDEVPATRQYRLSLTNTHGDIIISSVQFFRAARQNNWESEAAWSLRSIMHNNDQPHQSPDAYIHQVLDLTQQMNTDGHLKAELPNGNWTILRIGNVNTGKQNAPAPPEATGFECNKYSTQGADAHFAGYIGKLADGFLNGLLNGMLMDSWECETQTWTADMEQEFQRVAGYSLRPWLPALMGYVVQDPEKTRRFLRDWRATVNDLVVHKFYQRMAELGHSKGLSVTYETAGGDVFPSDIMEYFKYADIPMCEFWVHEPEVFVGTLNFKPIRPTASAGHLYGKPRIAVESFTSQQQTWDEQLSVLRETANKNMTQGATYMIYQAYTHNPSPDRLVPGSSFGDAIGTPFLRSQTWWPAMHDFNDCTARTSFLLERGRPVMDVLWYLGDEIDHKPDQLAPFPKGYQYDYCNPDVLLNRLSVDKEGNLVTPEGIRYRILWLPRTERMLPETLEKILQLAKVGATVVGRAPSGLATLSDSIQSQSRFLAARKALWQGGLASPEPLEEVLRQHHIQPDLQGGDVLWLHRQTQGADWYYVCAPTGGTFQGELTFRCTGQVELWNPVTGEITVPQTRRTGDGFTCVTLSLERAETCFVMFRHKRRQKECNIPQYHTVQTLSNAWTLSIPAGWGMDEPRQISTLAALRDLDLPDEAKVFSGTITYKTTFEMQDMPKGTYLLDLGNVQQVACVNLNGHTFRYLWTAPYQLDVTSALLRGGNQLTVQVMNTWFNRLGYDVKQPEGSRRTWTTNWPPTYSPIHDSGLLGPVNILKAQ